MQRMSMYMKLSCEADFFHTCRENQGYPISSKSRSMWSSNKTLLTKQHIIWVSTIPALHFAIAVPQPSD